MRPAFRHACCHWGCHWGCHPAYHLHAGPVFDTLPRLPCFPPFLLSIPFSLLLTPLPRDASPAGTAAPAGAPPPPLLDNQQFGKLCRDTRLVNASLTLARVDVIFARVAGKVGAPLRSALSLCHWHCGLACLWCRALCAVCCALRLRRVAML